MPHSIHTKIIFMIAEVQEILPVFILQDTTVKNSKAKSNLPIYLKKILHNLL
jgi:hypothetical protein